MPFYEVVGGQDSGGILVRTDKCLKSPKAKSRLETGSVVTILDRDADRVYYNKVIGDGPARGWVSFSVGNKDLLDATDTETLQERITRYNQGLPLLSDSIKCIADGAGEVAALEDESSSTSPGPPPSEGLRLETSTPGPNSTIVERCRKEWARAANTAWKMVSMDHLLQNHDKELPGMRYGIKFPHNTKQLLSDRYGAKWLTSAFHKAMSLPRDNSVTKIVHAQEFAEGGAGAKAIIYVEYQNPSPDLHTKLFVKLPFPLEGASKPDRMQISVNQQPGDLAEVDSYRLLEASLPFRIPKYYFADISNETTNFILITECVPYADSTRKLGDFQPFEVEPAYKKFHDDRQFNSAIEYYRTMTRMNATMAGWYKTGMLGDTQTLLRFFPEAKHAPQPLPTVEFKTKLILTESFVGEILTHLYPRGTVTTSRIQEWKTMLAKYNAYRSEIANLQNSMDDYFALHHINMNVDNTWWWCDKDKKQCAGVLDWGGLSKDHIGRKLWWSFYGAELHMLEEHLEELLQLVVDTYAAEGGPTLDIRVLRRDFLLAALDQALGLMGSVPMIYKVIPKKQWSSVNDIFDPRIEKQYLTRMYVRGFLLTFPLFFKFDVPAVLSEVVDEIHKSGVPEKQY